MYFSFGLLLCLVTLFTSTCLSLPVAPPSGPSLVARQEENAERKLFCTYNPSLCQDNFSPSTLVARQNPWEWNPQRALFCHFNPEQCQKDYPLLCTQMDPAPEFCTWNNPPPASGLDKRAAPYEWTQQRELQCHYNPEWCQREFPLLCVEMDPAPEFCGWNPPSGDEPKFCETHPHHPDCLSSYCLAHPGSCLDGV